jgi:peptidoglycan hydrolase CwlO-like protein
MIRKTSNIPEKYFYKILGRLMKKYYFVIAGIIIIAISILTSCNKYQGKKLENAKDNIKMAAQDLKDIHTENETEWQQFKNDAEVRINDNEKRIDEYSTEIKTTGGKIKEKYEKKS